LEVFLILITGTAGFIGFHVAQSLLEDGVSVVGVDNVNEYYDPQLKNARLDRLKTFKNYFFHKTDLCEYDVLTDIFNRYPIKKVCHLAAQAGVRYSLTHPFAYQKSNSEGFLNIIELSKINKIENFVYASSSSVYGSNTKLPFSEDDPVNNPVSLYAATKRANELTAHAYSHLFNLSCSGLRFFTVYGPWGRPDMALFLFTKAIFEDKPIQIYNNGDLQRNFTYVDDIVDGVIRVLNTPQKYEIYNIGNSKAEFLLDFIEEIEKNIGKKAIKEYLPMQPGDVKTTIADISKMRKIGYEPKTNISEGIKYFITWYKEYYQIK
jgi:UDP-glucuronate 4-epimerase